MRAVDLELEKSVGGRRQSRRCCKAHSAPPRDRSEVPRHASQARSIHKLVQLPYDIRQHPTLLSAFKRDYGAVLGPFSLVWTPVMHMHSIAWNSGLGPEYWRPLHFNSSHHWA